MSTICIQFCRLIDCEMSDEIFNSGSKMFEKLFTLISKLTAYSACTREYRNTPFLPINCLTRILTFHRHSEQGWNGHSGQWDFDRRDLYSLQSPIQNVEQRAFWRSFGGLLDFFVWNVAEAFWFQPTSDFEVYCMYNSIEKYAFFCQTIVWQ
jgi:hypothetical protein